MLCQPQYFCVFHQFSVRGYVVEHDSSGRQRRPHAGLSFIQGVFLILTLRFVQSILAEASERLPPSFLPTLLSQDADLYTKYVAALELYDATQRSPSTRYFLFNDSNGKTWARVCQTCTSILDSLTSSLYDAVETPELSRE